MSLKFSEDKHTCYYVADNGHVTKYRFYNGVYYHALTPVAVVRSLAYARLDRLRIRLHYGNTEASQGHALKTIGRDWMEENDVEGYIGNSMGPLKVPLLINSRSSGGGAILDHCIVKITTSKGKRVLYTHPNYSRPSISICEADNLGDYTHTVCYDGERAASFKSLLAAKRFKNKMES
jgi:hypothetical protein